jgi:hypothetical protein
MQYKIPVAVVAAMLVATSGIVVSSQNIFAAVSQNGINNPPITTLKGGGWARQTAKVFVTVRVLDNLTQ